MQVAHRWSDRNLSRIELIISLLLLALLIGFFSRYALIVFSRAEQNLVNSTLININTALHYRAAMALMRGKYEEVDELLEINPMQEMQQFAQVNNINGVTASTTPAIVGGIINTPANYESEVYSDDYSSLERGKWYFKQPEKYLFYIVDNSEFFLSTIDGPPRIRFKARILYEDRNENNRYDTGVDEFRTIRLEPMDSYQWLQ